MLMPALKKLIKDNLFYGDKEIESLEDLMVYILPIHHWLLDVRDHHDQRILNAARIELQKYFGLYKAAEYQKEPNRYTLRLTGVNSKGYDGVEIEIVQGGLRVFGLQTDVNFGMSKKILTTGFVQK